MFGYVMANKPELKIREYARYRGFYCGLCRRLKCGSGRLGQMTLTYDMTFLILLLSSLYEPAEKEERRFCAVHPGKKQWMIYNDITDYASDMNVLLAYYHFLDDWEDEKKLAGWCGSRVFAGKMERLRERYPRQAGVVCDQLKKLSELEKQNVCEPDAISRPFGTLMAEIFVYREDPFQDTLRQFGFYLGKYIYLLDAWMDLEKDREKGSFNPFLPVVRDAGFEERVEEMLDQTMRMAVGEFEKLPLEQDLSILRNILYEGVKIPLEKRKQGRMDSGDKEGERT